MGVVNRLSHLYRSWSSALKVSILRLNGRIDLGRYVSIHPDASVQANNGGSVRVGDGGELMKGVILMTYGGSIRIGERCSINPYTVIYGHGKGVDIGNDVLIAAHCVIVPFNHRFEGLDLPISAQGYVSKGIRIGDNVWIGAGARVLDGVSIGSGAVVAAGAVVNRDVDRNEIVAGVPAKTIGSRTSERSN